MANKKGLKGALVSSIVAVALSCTTFVGTTFAWFTDSVTSTGNVIQTGTLDVEMYWAEGKNSPESASWADASQGAIFDNELWEPGYVEARHIKISNNGTLALKYQLAIIPNGVVSKLAEVIDVYFNDPAVQVSRSTATAGTYVGTLSDVINNGIASGYLGADDKATTDVVEGVRTVTIVLKMKEEAGNEYQGLSIGSNFAVQLLATQYDAEEDSFDSDYDKDAWHPGMEVRTAADLQSALTNAVAGDEIVLQENIELNESIVIPAVGASTYSLRASGVTLNLNGNTIKGVKGRDAEGNRIHTLVNNGNLTIVGGTITSAGVNGGSAIYNAAGATLTIDGTVINGAPKVDGSWPSYAVNNYGVAVINNAVITSIHGGVSTSGENAVTTLNNVTATIAPNGEATAISSHVLYTYSNGNLIVNGGTYTNNAADATSTGGTIVCNNTASATIEINGGTFAGGCGLSEYSSGDIVVSGGTFDRNVNSYVEDGYKVVEKDGAYIVLFPQESFEGLIENAGDDAVIEIPAGNYTFPASDLKAGQTLNCAEGTTFTGTSSLNVNGATIVGATFDAGNGDTSATGTVKGTFKNCTFTGGSEGVRWCYTTAGETVVFENCVFEATLRGIHFDGMDGDVKFINCEINGFNAYGGVGTATFEGCTFGNDQSKYNGLNIYANTVITDCTFNFNSGKTNFIDMEETGKTLTISGCTATLDGKAANVADFVGGSKLAQCTFTLDGVAQKIVASQAELTAALVDNTAITIVGEIADATIKLPANLSNVTIKGGTLKNATISAADGNAYSYKNLTFDGITFDNSRLLLTGWRTGEETLEDLTITNCTFKNLNDDTNSAPVHINKDAAEAVVNFTFTNNVIDGATGGSKSGIYAQVTGKVIVSNNVINNVSFRPYVIQITTDDGIADEFIVTGNTFSGSASGRAQGLGNNAEGTDSVKVVVTGNIFKGITESQQICYWNFNDETTTVDLSGNYYDIDIVANPSGIYYNSAATGKADFIAKGLTTYYTALNADGTINLDSLVVVTE